jgi:hypothetical protein
MRRTSLIAALILWLASAASARAGEGLNLSWDDCGAFGVGLRTFACNTNTGQEVLIGSFVTDAAPHQLLGLSFTVDVELQSDLPQWWMVLSSVPFPGQCRDHAISVNADFSQGPGSCYDTFAGTAVGTVDDYEPGFGGPNRARITGSFVVPAIDPAPYPGVVETYAFRLFLGHAKSVGGACPGCSESACLVFSELHVLVGPGEPERVITAPLERNYVRWQSGPSPCQVPAGTSSWGAIKSLYR